MSAERLKELEEQHHKFTDDLCGLRTEEARIYCQLVVIRREVKNLEDQKKAVEQSINIEKKLMSDELRRM